MQELIRYSEQNRNVEALKGKYGYAGEGWGTVTVIKNLVHVIVFRGAEVKGYRLPEVYDGFLICSDGSTVAVDSSTLTLRLADGVSAQGILQLRAVN